MCILLYVKLTWCSGIPQMCGQLEGVCLTLVYVHSAICETYMVLWYSLDLWLIGGISALGRCAFCFMFNLFGVVVFHRSMISWRRGALLCVHSAICATYVVQWYSIDLWLIGRGLVCCWYMCILLYVNLTWCSGIP